MIKIEDGSYTVLLISDRKAEELKGFAQVAEEARQGAVNRKRSEKAQALIQALREEAKIENRLAEVLQALTPKTPSQDQPNSQEQPQPEEAPANNP